MQPMHMELANDPQLHLKPFAALLLHVHTHYNISAQLGSKSPTSDTGLKGMVSGKHMRITPIQGSSKIINKNIT